MFCLGSIYIKHDTAQNIRMAAQFIKSRKEKKWNRVFYLVSFYEGKIYDGRVVSLDFGNGFRQPKTLTGLSHSERSQ